MTRWFLTATSVLCPAVLAAAAEPIPFEMPKDAKPGTNERGQVTHFKLGLETNALKVYPPPESLRQRRNSPVDVDHAFEPRPIQTLEDWTKAREKIRKAVLDYFGEMPDRKIPLDAKVEKESDDFEHKVRHVTIAFDKARRGAACVLIPKGVPTPAAAVLMYDAYRDGTTSIDRLTGSLYSRAYAVHLVREGFVVVVLNHWDKVFGKSRRLSTIGATVHFTSRTIDYLQTQKDLVDPRRIGIWGHVYGAEVAQFCAAVDERIAAVVASNSWLLPTGHFNQEYYDPPFWADGKTMGGIIQCVERADPTMYQSRRRVNYAPLPFLSQELMALIAPRPYLCINHGMGAGRQETTATGARDCIWPVYKLYGRPKAMEMVEHRWGTNEPVNARDYTVDFYLRAMCGIHPGKVPEATVREILAGLRSGEKDRQVRSSWRAGWWKCREAADELAKLVSGQDVLRRRVAAKALQRIGDMDRLWEFVKHKDPMVRMCVIEAMQIHGTQETFEPLAQDETDPDKWVKEAKWQTLQVNPWE